MAGAYEQTATILKAIIDAEFATEGFVSIFDRLHESLGHDQTWIGISPERWAPNPRSRIERQTIILVQFYDKYDLEIDPAQQVSPTRIADFADRFEASIQQQQASTPGTDEVWYFDVDGIEFPQDPTGNKTRFHATVFVRGHNPSILD